MSQKKFVLKKVFILFLIGFTLQSAAQNNDCLVDMNGIGALKIGMRQDEIEKLLKQKFVLRNALDTAVSYNDTAMAKYKNSNVQLFF